MILLPKKADAAKAKDYRPISVICFFAKLIMKFLARRLQPKMRASFNLSKRIH
jgi:hypothetical protein